MSELIRSIFFGAESYYNRRPGINFYFTNSSSSGQLTCTSSVPISPWKVCEQYYLFTTVHELGHAAMAQLLLPGAKPEVRIFLDGTGGRTDYRISPLSYPTPICLSMIRAAGHLASSTAAGLELLLAAYTFGQAPYRFIPSIYFGVVAIKQHVTEVNELVSGLCTSTVDPESDFGKIMQTNSLHAAVAALALVSIWIGSFYCAVDILTSP